MEITQLSVRELKNKLANAEITSRQLTSELIHKIEADHNHLKPLNALITLLKHDALSMADKADKRIAKGETATLLGIPIIIKDNMNIKGIPTTCASKILDGYNASFDATVINRLREAGAVFIGKSNMDEFAMGSSSEHSVAGAVRNYRNRDYSPGGSSGGSASAVAAGWSPLALGSETGGSVRQPAAFCGVIGMKPTYGRVSRYGLVAFSSSIDQIGPFAREVEDIALLLQVISGHDKSDSTSSTEPVPDYLDGIDKDISNLKIGLPKEYFSEMTDPQVMEKTNQSINKLKDLGCTFIDISLPHTEYGIPVYYVVTSAEASSNLSRYDGIRYGYSIPENDLHNTYLQSRSNGFGMETKRRIILGTYVLSSGYYDAYYLKAQKVRTLIKQDFVEAFNQVDAILTPTSPTTAFKIGAKLDNPLQMYLSDVYTVNVNLAGLPGISLPFGEDDHKLPVGVQLIGNYFHEKTLLNIAWHLQKSSLL